ncbi:MAG: hypothetical protein J6A59_10860 [Lachnospiraceae bacterium]|nr:hypothetical protein [Lachnospiraceae bacterium]
MREPKLVYTDTGQKLDISIELPYNSLTCIKLPEHCMKCPNGYSNDCGRNIPFKPEDYVKRPNTCKLKEVDIRELIEEKLKELGV